MKMSMGFKVIACVMVLSMMIGTVRPSEALPSLNDAVETVASVAGIGGSATYLATRAGVPAIWQGIKILGCGVGGVGGLTIVGTLNGLSGAVVVNNTLLADDKNMNTAERNARSMGRAASYLGGVAASMGSVAAITGSGATITSSMATIGGIVGGGMAAGGAVLIAAPAAVAAVTGIAIWGTVRLWQWAFK